MTIHNFKKDKKYVVTYTITNEDWGTPGTHKIIGTFEEEIEQNGLEILYFNFYNHGVKDDFIIIQGEDAMFIEILEHIFHPVTNIIDYDKYDKSKIIGENNIDDYI